MEPLFCLDQLLEQVSTQVQPNTFEWDCKSTSLQVSAVLIINNIPTVA